MQNYNERLLAEKAGILMFCLLLMLTPNGFGQTPPPNDNYSNRIVLAGTDIVFGGTLNGATLEDQREASTFLAVAGQATQSVWWTWTAPVSGDLTFQMLSTSLLNSSSDQVRAGLAIYQSTNGSTTPAGIILPALGFELTDFRVKLQTLSIPVVAGSNYDIQLVGMNSASYVFRMVVTNTPVIIQQPRSQTLYSNASALFYVVAAGVNQGNFSFQWFFNGAAIAGETAPMVALTNINSSMAGAYSVAVSNAAGITTSQPAVLTVSQMESPISLASLGAASGTFEFSLAGESNRNYRIQSSQDLAGWSNDMEFAISPYVFNSTSIVFNTNSPLGLSVANNTSQKFFRATPYVIGDSNAEICINNLRKIRVAKLLWQRIYPQAYSTTPTSNSLLAYYPHGQAPFCPYDSTKEFIDSYTINWLQTVPYCLIKSSHVLEEPQ